MASELVSEAISCAIEYPYLNLTLELSGGEAVRLERVVRCAIWQQLNRQIAFRRDREAQSARV